MSAVNPGSSLQLVVGWVVAQLFLFIQMDAQVGGGRSDPVVLR